MSNERRPSATDSLLTYTAGRLSVESVKSVGEKQVITISSVRESFISKYDDNVHNFHIKDVERIKSDDMFFQRFINGAIFNDPDANVQNVIDLIFKVLSWRQEYKINDMSPTDLPVEIVKCGLLKQAILPNGDIMICIIARRYRKVDEIMEKAILPGIFWYYEYCIVPNLKPDTRLHILFDGSGCGLNQADTILITAGVPILINYYPGLVSKCYIYNMPWILKPFITLFRPLIPKKFTNIGYIMNDKNMNDFMGSVGVPDILGGDIVTTDLYISDTMPDFDNCGIWNRIKKQNMEKFRKMLSDAFNIK